jgi:hypothetical protein
MGAQPLGSKLLAPPPVLGWGGDVARTSAVSWRRAATRVTTFLLAHRASVAVSGIAVSAVLGLVGVLQMVRGQGDASMASATAAVIAPTTKSDSQDPPASADLEGASTHAGTASAPQLPTVPAAQLEGPRAAEPRNETKATAATKSKSPTGSAPQRATATLSKPTPAEPSAPSVAKFPPPPAPPPAPAELQVAGEFDRNAAMEVMRRAGDAARGCASGATSGGNPRVSVTFARTGQVADAHVEGPSAGTPAGQCISGKFRSLRVPPFRGSSVTVYKTIIF